MNWRWIMLVGMSTLSACTTIQESGQRAATRADKDMQKLGEKVKEMFTYYPPKKTKLQPVSERYCYRVMQDVMCYSEAMPGGEGRLVAYQGNVEVYDEPVIETGVWNDEPVGTTPVSTAAYPDAGQTSMSMQDEPPPSPKEEEGGMEALDARNIPVDKSAYATPPNSPLKPLKSQTIGAAPTVAGIP